MPQRQRIVHKLWQDPLNRHLVVAVALKFILLALLWWFFVRDYRSDPGSIGVGTAILPPSPAAAAATHKDPAP